jgi:hypothetical protein
VVRSIFAFSKMYLYALGLVVRLQSAFRGVPLTLSVTRMPMNPSKPCTNFGVLVNVVGEDGWPVDGADGRILKKKIQMQNRQFNRQEQDFYFPHGHKKAGIFKGMAAILTECGYNVSKKRAQCRKSFADCLKGINNCCCQHILYNKPDFAEEELMLKTCCQNRRYNVHFFLKFYCETSFIE